MTIRQGLCQAFQFRLEFTSRAIIEWMQPIIISRCQIHCAIFLASFSSLKAVPDHAAVGVQDEEEFDADEAERLADERQMAGDVDMDGEAAPMEEDEEEEGPGNEIVLAEDKKYYPSAEETYGEGVETLVMDEDAQPLEQPIIAAVKNKKFETLEREPLKTR
eukprot:gene19958-26666_t